MVVRQLFRGDSDLHALLFHLPSKTTGRGRGLQTWTMSDVTKFPRKLAAPDFPITVLYGVMSLSDNDSPVTPETDNYGAMETVRVYKQKNRSMACLSVIRTLSISDSKD